MAKKLICYPFITNNDGTDTLQDWVNVELDDNERELCYKQGNLITTEYNQRILWHKQQRRNLTLTYQGYGRGRSSVTFYWKDQDGNGYPMFLKDMDYMLKNNKVKSKISGEFEFIKRGQNYGIKMCEN